MDTLMNKPMILGALFASTLLVSFQASAESKDLDEQLLKCFEMSDEKRRMVCYDDISRAIASANPEKQEVVKQRAIADFGLSHQKQAHDEMVMKAVKVDREPAGKWLITMENGQVWQQTDDERYNFNSKQPEVRIFKMLFGSYAMTEVDRSKKIRVKRIQ